MAGAGSSHTQKVFIEQVMQPKDSDRQAKNGVQGRRINMEIQMGHSQGLTVTGGGK